MTETEKAAFAANAAKLLSGLNDKDDKTIVNMLNMRMEAIDPDQASLTVAFTANPWEHNLSGVIHGGVVCAMFDMAMGVSAYAASGALTPTMSLTTSFVRPAPGEGTLMVRARVAMAGRTAIYTSAEMWEAQTPDKIVATAQGVFRNLASQKNPA